jgi:hypothetical protein
MNNSSGSGHKVLSWLVGASLLLAPAVLAPYAQSQQGQPQQNQAQPGQSGDWGQAGPPPDAQNGEIPPPPSDAQSSDTSQNGTPAPANGQNGAPPPTGAQNGQYPAQPPQPSYGQQSRGPYQASPQGYPNQGYPSQGYPSQGYPSQGNQGQVQAPQPSGPVNVPAGTLLKVRLSEALDTKKLQPGDYFQGTVAQGVYSGNILAIPRGAEVVGRVVDVKKAGELKGSPGFLLQLTTLNMGGQSYPLVSDVWSFDGPGKGGYTAGNAVGGAALGAVIGAIAGGGTGAAIGAAAGTGAGLGASAITPGPRGVIPPESLLTFHLTQPATVRPVSYQEAEELQQNSAPPQPRAYPRYGYPPPAPVYAPGPYYYPAPYAYAYPYPYVYAYPYPYARYYRYRYWR